MQSAKCKFSFLSKPKAFMIGLFRKRAVSIQTMCITGTNKLPGPGKAVSENGMPFAWCIRLLALLSGNIARAILAKKS